MDEKLKNALDFSNFVVTFNNQKNILFEEYQQDVIVYENGGEFNVSISLINFCKLLINDNINEFILLDNNNIPIYVDINSFYTKILSIFKEANQKYYSSYKQLLKSRTTNSFLDV